VDSLIDSINTERKHKTHLETEDPDLIELKTGKKGKERAWKENMRD